MSMSFLRRCAFQFIAFMLGLCVLAAQPARAEIAATATSDQTIYVRGHTNRFVFRVTLYSEEFEYIDNLHFVAPEGLTVSASLQLDSAHDCPDALLLALGTGTRDAGWYNPGHPSGCGAFITRPQPDGWTHVVLVDVDVPADYAGDLPIEVHADGDGCCDPPPHDAVVTLVFTDTGSPVRSSFDDVRAPVLPSGWVTDAVDAGVAWSTASDNADSAPNDVHAPTPGARGESALTSPDFAISPAGGELRFRHRYATESQHDGGVLEIAIDGGAFEDIVSAGGAFRAGAYDSQLVAGNCNGADANPLAGRDAWSGTQDPFTTVAVTLPTAAAGHHAQFRWRLGTDCSDQAPVSNGWWIDSVVVVPNAPVAAIGPGKLAVALGAGARTENIKVANAGAGTLDYTLATADSDCASPNPVSWIRLAAGDGNVGGGETASVPVEIDSTGLALGQYHAQICVASSDPAAPVQAIPVDLDVVIDAPPCTGDRLFIDGFDGAVVPGQCRQSLRTFTSRDAFIDEIAPGYSEDRFTALRTGRVRGPVDFGNAQFPYTLDAVNLFGGAGVLSNQAAEPMVLTFTGDEPVTAVGGNFFGTVFYSNITPPTIIILTLDDGRSETFTPDNRDAFRGFISSTPIHSLSIFVPGPNDDQEYYLGVADNLVVGRAR